MPDTQNLLSQFYIQLDGGDAPVALMRAVEQISVESSLHLPDVATLVVHDPGLQWIDADQLAPGTAVVIAAQADNNQHTIFEGEIVEIEPELGIGTQKVIVRAFDRMHRLNRGRHVRSFLNVSDTDLVQRAAQEVGLQVKADPTRTVHPYVLQANETNLAFLQRRAAALGYLIYVRGSTIHFGVPASEPGEPVELEWGDTLTTFSPRLTTIGQFNTVTVRSWDSQAKRSIVGQAEKGKSIPQVGESQNGGELAQKAFNLTAQDLLPDCRVRSQDAAALLAQAIADRHASRFIEAEGSCLGIPQLIAGTPVKVNGVGRRFSGTYLATSVTHQYDAEAGYVTTFTVSGLNPATLFSLLIPEEPEATAPPGLVIGIVTNSRDPEGMGRVKVKFPWLTDEHESDWARIVTLGGGATRGFHLLPEVNDEVLVGFEQGDIQQPYIIGGLWNGQDKPSGGKDLVSGDGKVQKRVLRSRTGHEIVLDDSDSGGVTISDSKGNKIKLNSRDNSLTIESQGDMTLTTQGNLALKARGNLSLEAQGRTEVKGTDVKVDGAATVDVNGGIINLN